MLRVLVDVPLNSQERERLKQTAGLAVTFIAETSHKPGDQPRRIDRAILEQQEVLLSKWPPDNLADARELKFMQLVTVGFEHLAHRYPELAHLRICNARGIFDTAIAEWNIAMMINLIRNVPQIISFQKNHHYQRLETFQQEIRNRRVGIWGYGGIGRTTAYYAKFMGMKISVLTRSGKISNGYTYLPDDPIQKSIQAQADQIPDRIYGIGQELEFLRELDFLILCLPRTKQSNGRIGEKELQALPKHAYLLNPARGLIVQEAALLKALEEKWIAGAALDTHFQYPLPPQHPLWEMPNVILTPHISGGDGNDRFPERITNLFLENIRRYQNNETLLHLIQPEEWLESRLE